ncbi:hypothetical protein ACHAWF_004904 [Thalassiosira exigua]
MCIKPDCNIVLADAAEYDHTEKCTKKSDCKKRDRVLPKGVIIRLMKKSDWEGFKRFFSNISFIITTALVIHHLDCYPSCMAFAGGHELNHGNAFKTKWMNIVASFFVSTAFFEVSWHEKYNHKLHHIYTLDIDRDPELTSFYSRKELENLNFKSVPDSRYSWFKAFVDVLSYFQHRACRLISGAMGIMTDYTGTGYSMSSPQREEIDPTVVGDLQFRSVLQLSVYVLLSLTLGRTREGWKAMLFWWIIPCVVGYGPINYFRNAEHAGCDLVPNQLHNTRTVESNFLVRWLLWETNYHCEHHAYPGVPFYNLPKLHELLDPYIKHNDCKTFTAQQIAMLRRGGWIEQQNPCERR